jgi:hypothetical protein
VLVAMVVAMTVVAAVRKDCSILLRRALLLSKLLVGPVVVAVAVWSQSRMAADKPSGSASSFLHDEPELPTCRRLLREIVVGRNPWVPPEKAPNKVTS